MFTSELYTFIKKILLNINLYYITQKIIKAIISLFSYYITQRQE